jgi:hypothetical protein
LTITSTAESRASHSNIPGPKQGVYAALLFKRAIGPESAFSYVALALKSSHFRLITFATSLLFNASATRLSFTSDAAAGNKCSNVRILNTKVAPEAASTSELQLQNE